MQAGDKAKQDRPGRLRAARGRLPGLYGPCAGKALCLVVACLLMAVAAPAAAQQDAPPADANADAAVTVPGFWDPQRRPVRPDLGPGTVIRFVTEIDYPPFNYASPDGSPIGFSVDLARMLCEELGVACTVQMRRFDTLLDALAENRGDAVIASLAATPEARRRAAFTDPYYRSPARFVTLGETAEKQPLAGVNPEHLAGIAIGVVQGTAHEAYIKTFFPEAVLRAYPDDAAARKALREGAVRLLFGDAIQLSFWLNGSDSAACCRFEGGPFTESHYFGEGIGIAVRPGNEALRHALNWALWQLWSEGRFTDLWLRYFPISPF